MNNYPDFGGAYCDACKYPMESCLCVVEEVAGPAFPMKSVNPNYRASDYIQGLINALGIEVKPLEEGRSKSIGFMGESGEYEVGSFTVDDYAHYGSVNDPRSWGIKFINGKSFTLAQDSEGEVWCCFKSFAALDESEDWHKTDITIN